MNEIGQTIGESRVNLKQDVTEPTEVRSFREIAAKFIDKVEELRYEASGSMEQQRLINESQISIETALMYAVKSYYKIKDK